MHQLPFLHSYGEQSMGEGVPSLTIGITRDGKTGMSGANLAKLFRCNPLDLPALIYGKTGGFIAYKNGPKPVKSQSGRGFSTHTTHRIPLSHRAGGKELHLYPSDLIATASLDRLFYLIEKGVDRKTLIPLRAFITHFAAKGLDVAIKTALGWQATDRFLRAEDEVKPYEPLFSTLQRASLEKWDCTLPPGAWLTIEEIIPGMAQAARNQRNALGINYNHMAFSDDGRNRLSIDAEKAMLLLEVSCSPVEYLRHLEAWRSGMWQQKLDITRE